MATFYARKANKLLKINEDAIDRYLGQGYSITDLQGNLVKKGTPHDTIQLTAEYKKQEEEIVKLKAENESLKTKVKALQDELNKFKSAPISAEPKTTTTRKRKSDSTKKDEE